MILKMDSDEYNFKDGPILKIKLIDESQTKDCSIPCHLSSANTTQHKPVFTFNSNNKTSATLNGSKTSVRIVCQ